MENNIYNKKTIGILGGMGPDATAYLFKLIIQLTEALEDQGHIKTIVYNNPAIPDRTQAILFAGESPLDALIEGAQILKQAGADFILMPCVTAHHFHDAITSHIDIPFVNLLDVTLNHIRNHREKLNRIGLIATPATIQTGLFQDLIETQGMELVVPDKKGIDMFMEAIYCDTGLKNGFIDEPKLLMLQVANQLREQKVQAIIAGCSEIPLVLAQEDIPDTYYINPIRLMAEEGIRRAGYRVKGDKHD